MTLGRSVVLVWVIAIIGAVVLFAMVYEQVDWIEGPGLCVEGQC